MALDTGEFVETLKYSSIGRDILAEKEKAETEARKKIAAEIAAIQAERAATHPKNMAAAEEAYRELVGARQVFLEVQRKLYAVCCERDRNSMRWHTAIEKLEWKLRGTCSPAIAAFVSEMLDAQMKREPIQTREHKKVDTRGRPTLIRESNIESINARKRALLAAMHEAEALALEPDQSSVPQRLAQIRAAIPKVSDL